MALGEGWRGLANRLAAGLPAGGDQLAEPPVFLAPAERWIGASSSYPAEHFTLHPGELLWFHRGPESRRFAHLPEDIEALKALLASATQRAKEAEAKLPMPCRCG